MGAGTGTALRGLKFFLRAVQFGSAAVVLALFSYFLAALANHSLPTPNWIRAVEGIAGFAVLYTLLCILALWCFPNTVKPFTSLVGMVLDGAFAAAFIYVAAANKGGSGSCTGNVDTPFGSGDAETGKVETGQDGFTALPSSLRQACQIETACLAVAVVAIFFFIFSILAEVASVRHRRKETRLGLSPANDYTSGYATKRPGVLARLFGRKKDGEIITPTPINPNALPEHAHPDDVRDSYATEQTRVGSAGSNGVPKYDRLGYEGHDIGGHGQSQGTPGLNDSARWGDELSEGGYAGHTQGTTGTGAAPGLVNEARWDDVPLATYPPGNYRYSDGVYDRV